MALDSIVISGLAAELNDTLRLCRIDKIYQPSKSEISFSVRVNNKSKRLNIIISGQPAVYLTDEKRENPEKAPMFCMLLRKHLIGSKILSVTQPEAERIIIMELECINELRDIVNKKIIIELMGRNSNFILCDHDMRIIDCMRKSDYEACAEHPVLPGLFYKFPAKPRKADPFSIDERQFDSLLAQQCTEKELTADMWLMNNFMSVSPLTAREAAFRSCSDVKPLLSALTDTQKQALRCQFFDIFRNYTNRHPYLMIKPGEAIPFDFCFMPITQYGSIINKECSSYSEMLSEFFDIRRTNDSLSQMKSAVLKGIKTSRDRLKRKLAEQNAEIEAAKGREILKINADLIMANIYNISRGQNHIKVINLFDEKQSEIDIKLDIKLTPHQNAQKYYKEYAKKKNAEKILSEKLKEGEEELFYLESVIDELSRAESCAEISVIKDELQSEGYLKESIKRKKPDSPAVSSIEYRTPNGFLVLVGRNNKENELLTLKTASKGDIWFHVKNAPGSHVILVTEQKTPSDEDYTISASIAAYHSSVKGSSNIPVDFTEVRNVKKLHGGKTGMVNYFNYKTAFVTPDNGLLPAIRVR